MTTPGTTPVRWAWLFSGQGSQRKGMGVEYYEQLPGHWALADRLLGFSVREVCADDSQHRLRDTRHLQPVLFVLNAIAALSGRDREPPPDHLAGHSLGELNALFAADCFDFETGIRLVCRRGELMAAAAGGAMVAVVGLDADRLGDLIDRPDLPGVEVSNYNARTQTVLSCPRSTVAPLIARVAQLAAGAGDASIRAVPLNVSASFHSRDMTRARSEFADYLSGVPMAEPRIPVVSNVTALPHEPGRLAEMLGRQIREPVRWRQSMLYLLAQGTTAVTEIGPGRVLTGFWESARAEPAPAEPAPTVPERASRPQPRPQPRPQLRPQLRPEPRAVRSVLPESLGSADFRRVYGTRWSYASGSMYRGIASASMVARMAGAGLLSFFGAGGLGLAEIERAIDLIRAEAGPEASFGMNLLYDMDDAAHEMATVALYLRREVRFVEAAAYLAVTEALVRFRFSGAHRDRDGRPVVVRHIVAKVSRPEVAAAFVQPAPARMVARLLARGELSAEEAEVAALLPVSGDICVEGDSAGHSDGGVTLALVPGMVRLCADAVRRHNYSERIRVGASGGLGAPEAVAAVFVLGADFVVTGSVNQCTVQAGTSAVAKDMLAAVDVQDTAYAPAGDMFELGARVQVVRKGTLFAARGNKLYQLYRRHDGLAEIDERTRRAIEDFYLRRPFDEVWQLVREHYTETGRAELAVTTADNPKQRMSAVFRWYFGQSSRSAMDGDTDERANFQIHCGPALGAFNRLVRGGPMQDWRSRQVDEVASLLMTGAAETLSRGGWSS